MLVIDKDGALTRVTTPEGKTWLFVEGQEKAFIEGWFR